MKVKIVCSKCGSDNILKDAWTIWDVEQQEWVLHSVYDTVYCEDCEEETDGEEIDKTYYALNCL